MLFCPTCTNLLIISADSGRNKWACNTCAYEFPIENQVLIYLSYPGFSDHGVKDDIKDTVKAKRS